MERKIYERLRTATKERRARELPDSASDRELRRAEAHGESLERLPEFQLDELEALLIDDNIISEIVRMIGQGKEANVYWIRDPDGRDQALKLFRIHTTSHQDRFSKVDDTAKLLLAEELALREYMNLHFAMESKVNVPRPIERQEFVFTMEFLGNETGPAPLLRHVDLVEEGQDPIGILEQILDELYIMFNTTEMVHGDFSEHNLVWYDDQIWVIDLLQSDRWHPKFDTDVRIRKREAIEILEKDVLTILTHFKKKYRQSFEFDDVMEHIIDDPVDDWAPDELMGAYEHGDWMGR